MVLQNYIKFYNKINTNDDISFSHLSSIEPSSLYLGFIVYTNPSKGFIFVFYGSFNLK